MEERRIFLELLDLDTAEERANFLESTCGSDPVLRERITSLFQRHNSERLAVEVAQDLPETGVGLGETFSQLPTSEASKTPQVDVTSILPATPREFAPGTSISHCRIERLIGRGGAGAIYEAFDSRLNRRVALKFLSEEQATDDTARERFLREARAVAAVDHPHVVTIYSVEDDPLPYLVMELVTGETLASRIEAIGSLSVKEIVRIGQQIAVGLASAHREGVIHRDLKPANILLKKRRDTTDGEPQVVIVDFGLAKGEGDVEVTKVGYIAGTPAYMSPEQALGRPLDARSDLFSLGSVIYAMCVGRAPFRADTVVAVLRSVVDDPHVSVTDRNPEIPDTLHAIVDRLLSKNPADRFQSADEVATALSTALVEQTQTLVEREDHRVAVGQRQNPQVVAHRPSPWRRWIAFFGGAAIVLLSGFVIKLTLPDGTSTTVTSDTDQPAKVRLGDVSVEVTPAATASPPQEGSPKGGPGTMPSDELQTKSPEYRGAAAVLALGGYVRIRDENENEADIMTLAELPREPFQVLDLQLKGLSLPIDALECVHALQHLRYIELQRSNVTAQHLEQLGSLPALSRLGLYHCAEIDDEALKTIAKCEAVAELHLHATQVTNAGLPALAGLPSLRRLWLCETQVDDAGLKALGELKHLQLLDLSGCKVTSAAVRQLRSRLRDCDIRTGVSEQVPAPELVAGDPALLTDPLLQSLVAPSSEWTWTEPELLGNGINSDNNDSQPHLTPDGLELWFHGSRQGWVPGHKILQSRRAAVTEPFPTPTLVAAPINLDTGDYRDASSPRLTADGLDAFFVSIREGTGHMDVFTAHRNSVNEGFQPPVNLGEPINSSTMELSPAISGDGLTLIYSAFGRTQASGTDLYETRRTAREQPFGPPVNLGETVNSPQQESGAWLSLDGRVLVFRSSRNAGVSELFLTTRANLETPFHAPLKLAAPFNCGIAGVHEDGFAATADWSTVVIASNRPGGPGMQDLWITRRVPKSSAAH